MPIKARVIRIFDEYTVAINAGTAQGVKPGMEFGIYSPTEDIIDPETKANLGQLRHRKAVIEASSLFLQFTVCRTPTRYRSRRVTLGPLTGEPEPIQNKLPVISSEVKPYAGGTNVRVGDDVEEIEKPKD